MSAPPVKQPLPSMARFSLPYSASSSMAWKEFRQNLPLFVAFVAVMAITLTAAALDRYATPGGSPANTDAIWHIIIIAYMNLFALTIGVFLFAPEKENRTAPMLSHMPITSGFAVRTKISNGLLAIGAFAVVGLLFLAIEIFVFQASITQIYGIGDSFFVIVTALYAGVLMPIECFFWGVICSLTIKRTIFAAIAGAGCVLLFSWILPGLVAASIGYQPPNTQAQSWAVLGSIKVLFLLVGCVVLQRQGLKWLGNSPQQKPPRSTLYGSQAFLTPVNSLSKAAIHGAPRYPVTQIRIYNSLIWQSFRQSRSTMFWAIGLGVLCLAFAFTMGNGPKFLTVVSTGFSVIVLGGSLFAFSKDHQDGNYRFFQQHVEHGRKFWFSRLLPSGLLAGACLFAFYVCTAFLGWLVEGSDFPSFYATEYFGWFAITTLTMFAIGQFNSMFYRSGVYAFADTILMIGVTVGWMSWLTDFDANLWLYFAPVPVALLVITWWRAPHWLADRNRIRDILTPHAAAILVALATFGAFAFQRYTEFPGSDLSLTAQMNTYASLDRKRPVEFQGARFIRDAAELMVMTPESDELGNFRVPAGIAIPETSEQLTDANKFLEANRHSLDMVKRALDAKNQKPILNPKSIAARTEQVKKIRFLISIAAQRAELEGNLRLALDHWKLLLRFDDLYAVNHDQISAVESLMRWSDLPGQTPQLLKQAIDELNYTPSQWRQRADNATYFNQLDFENWYQELKNYERQGLPYQVNYNSNRSFLAFAEMERSRRITHRSIEKTNRRFYDVLAEEATNPAATLGHPSLSPSFQGAVWRLLGVQIPNYERPKMGSTQRSREFFHVDGYGCWQEVVEILKTIQKRRYAQVKMALNSSRLENGSYPINLQEIVPEYFQVLPKDVVDGGDFEYAPKGYDSRVSWTSQQQRVLPNMPFLLPWSVQKTTRERPIENGSHQFQYTGVFALNFSDRQSLVCRNWFHFPFELKESIQPGSPERKQQD